MSDSTVFVDFLDINKSHRRKIYQNTSDYDKLAEVLSEFQMKVSLSSLGVKTYKILEVLCMYIYSYMRAHTYIKSNILKVCVWVCVRDFRGKVGPHSKADY